MHDLPPEIPAWVSSPTRREIAALMELRRRYRSLWWQVLTYNGVGFSVLAVGFLVVLGVRDDVAIAM